MKILAVAGDAGGARALQPVINYLQRKSNVIVECAALNAAINIWTVSKLEVGSFSAINVKSFDKVLLGTSVSTKQDELKIIRQAKNANIPTISVLDFWTNYRERFTAANGNFILPTAITVMDEKAYQEMSSLGFPPEILYITGQPAFDELKDYFIEDKNSSNKVLPKLNILYVSQPLSQLYSWDALGFDEYEVWRDVVSQLSIVLEKHRQPALLTLKLHPREATRNYDLTTSKSEFLQIVKVKAFDNPRRLVQNSDFVIGMNSILLMEACFLSKPVISYQPNLRVPNPLPSNDYGWSRSVYKFEHLISALESELFNEKIRHERKRILRNIPREFNASEKVAELILNI